MRQPFWNKESLSELVQEYKSSTYYALRIAWENRYNQPSHGNPLFEDVPVATHVLHFLAIEDDGGADHADRDGQGAPVRDPRRWPHGRLGRRVRGGRVTKWEARRP